ncbi:unnamed protein product [Urochloa humidicola]
MGLTKKTTINPRPFACDRTFAAIRVHGQCLCADGTSKRRGRTRQQAACRGRTHHQVACRRLIHRLPCWLPPLSGGSLRTAARGVDFFFLARRDARWRRGRDKAAGEGRGVADLLAAAAGDGVHEDRDDDDEMRGAAVVDLGVGRRGGWRGKRERTEVDGGRRDEAAETCACVDSGPARHGSRREDATSPPASPPPRQPPSA